MVMVADAVGANSKIKDERAIKKTPAVTRVAA
jgi:hypothetical protein